ncbi:MAG: AAA family ATPase [Planctomycetota bacterium]
MTTTGWPCGCPVPLLAEAADGGSLGFYGEQILILATVVGAIAALPPLIEFLVERKKRKERLALSLDVEDVADLAPRIAGLEEVLEDARDLIDRARNPEPYAGLGAGNEVLILGPQLIGKQSLAQRIAKEASFDRLITVYNPRNKDALAKAKSLLVSFRRHKVMLLIPNIDHVFDREDEDLRAELDALIETTTERKNVLVIGTATRCEPASDLDNLFGTKLVLPGMERAEVEARPLASDARLMLSKVARFYLDSATTAGVRLAGLSPEQVVERLLAVVSNAAEIEDILVLSRTAAIHRKRSGRAQEVEIGPEILERAISRVIVHVASRPGSN